MADTTWHSAVGEKNIYKIAGLPGSLHRVSALPAPPQVANQLPAQVIVQLSTKTCTLTAMPPAALASHEIVRPVFEEMPGDCTTGSTRAILQIQQF